MTEDHPLCHSTAPSTIPAVAAELAELHRRMRSRKITDASFFDTLVRDDQEGLQTTMNHQGMSSPKMLCAQGARLEST